MDRRFFIQAAMGLGLAGGAGWLRNALSAEALCEQSRSTDPVHAIIPVVGDGKWIWTEPPKNQTGYLEPRDYDLKIGIQLQGTGPATQLRAATAAPLALDGQIIQNWDIRTQGCVAKLRAVTPEAGQLTLAASAIQRGQIILAVCHYRLTLHKDYRGFDREQFPVEQEFPKPFKKRYLYDSPGIQTRFKEVRRLSEEIGGQFEHPWEKARAYHKWVWENIKGQAQNYTSVVAALRDRIGDCEERAAAFVAFCRVAGIPARLVWVPNHNWAEFFLKDEEGRGHWIPAHTSAYSWFGWTGAHEMVLQKGDSIVVPEKRKPQRLLADWMQWQGSRPKVQYLAELTPLAGVESKDPGPGARVKDKRGAWNRVGKHPLDPYCRDGAQASQRPPSNLGQTPPTPPSPLK